MKGNYSESLDGIESLQDLHSLLKKLESKPPLPNGFPRYLFRAEQNEYPHTFTSMDRHYHNGKLSEDAYEELDAITAFVMLQPFPEKQLRGREAAAYAQHYGLPTQIFDFTASANVAIFFAANRHPFNTPALKGNMAILDVETALNGPCEIDDLRHHKNAVRSVLQAAFGVLYTGFIREDFYSLKDPYIREKIGLDWISFVHLEDDGQFLKEIGADKDILSTENDPFANFAQELVDEYVRLNGSLQEETACILSNNVPAINRTRKENFLRWTKIAIDQQNSCRFVDF